LQLQVKNFDVHLKMRDDLCLLALQGPEAITVLEHIFDKSISEKVSALKKFQFIVLDNDIVIARTGYTGETGVEMIMPVQNTLKIWKKCIAQGIQPCGLGARNTLRLEAGLNLYGADMTEEILKRLKFENKQMNCIIIHGCPSDEEKAMNSETRTYDKHWIPWIKKELSSKGIKTETPLMPKPWKPDYNRFKCEFEKYKVTEDTVLVGHSCGSAFLVRWLGETKQKISKLILVAPWKIPDKNDEDRIAFYTYLIDKTIKSRVKKIVMFTADDEEDDGKKSVEIFHKSLGGKVIELKGHGHYTLGDMGTEEFPELLKEILD